MSGPSHSISLGFTSEPFPAGTHMCYIFNDDDERHDLIAKFLESGLLGDEKVRYFASAFMNEPVADALRDLGVAPPPSRLKAGQFEESLADDVYCPCHVFSPEHMFEGLREFYSGAMAEGYAGARASGEMEWALKGIPGSERLIEYEAGVNLLVADYPFTAICQYDARLFDGETLFEVLRVHPMMVIRGRVVHNPYYIPAEDYLKRFLPRA
jgi:hypothetical protein